MSYSNASIGIPVEVKARECRVSLVPADVRRIVTRGHSVLVERGAGRKSGFSNSEYKRAGAMIVGTGKRLCNESRIVVWVKQPPLETLRTGCVVMAYLHVKKGQSPCLIKGLLRKRVTSYAYECITDRSGRRLVSLGRLTGIVGMIESLKLYLEREGIQQALISKTSWDYATINHSREHLKRISKKWAHKPSVTILGRGRVTRGCRRVLSWCGIRPEVLWRDRSPRIREFIPGTDILVNAVSWKPDEPRIVTRNMLGLLKKHRTIIVDISCDRCGAVETCKPTSWDNPTYQIGGVLHFCVDNLPSAMAREASRQLSRMILPHVLRVVEGRTKNTSTESGLTTQDGKQVWCPQATREFS